MHQKRRASPSSGLLNAADTELLHQALRDAEKRAALLTELIEALNQSRDAVSLLQRAVEAVVRATSASGAFVYLWDSDLGRFIMRAATEGHQKAFVGLISLRPGEGITGWSALMRRPVLINENLTKDPRFVHFPELQESEFRSCLIVPILVPGGETVGVFSIYSIEELAFSERDLYLVDEVAKLLASGIDRAHVIDLWERQSAALEALVGAAESAPGDVPGCLTDLAHRSIGMVPSDVCIVESLQADGSPSESVALVLRRDGDQGGTGVAELSIQAAKEMAKSTTRPLHSASVPLRLGERALGVLTLHRTAAFTTHDRALLAAIAASGAFALQGLTNRSGMESALGALMAAMTEADASAVLERFGWVPGTYVVAVVVRCDPELRLTSQRSLERVTQTIESVFTGRRRRSLPTTSGVVSALVLVSSDGPQTVGIAAELRHDIAVALTDKGQTVGVTVGIGRPAAAALEIACEFRAAAEASAWAAASASTPSDGVRVAVAAEQDLPRRLLALSPDLLPAIGEQLGRIRRVTEHDVRNGTDLLGTMEVFVRERGSIQQTADVLFIHRNTLRQRLNKISRLINEPIEVVDDWLALSLAIRMLRSVKD